MSCKFRNGVRAPPSAEDHVRGYVFKAAAARIKGRRHARAVAAEMPLSRFIVRRRSIRSSPRTHECTHARHERQLPYYVFACAYTVASHQCDKRRRFAPVSETARRVSTIARRNIRKRGRVRCLSESISLRCVIMSDFFRFSLVNVCLVRYALPLNYLNRKFTIKREL